MAEGRRGYSWPPFEPGNDAATKHGAHSERRWRPIADRLASELVEVAPWAAKPTHAATVAAWAKVEAQMVLLGDYLDEHGLVDDEGGTRPALAMATKLESAAQRLREQLGLGPLNLARLVVVAQQAAGPEGDDGDLAALRAEGRRILEAREAVGALGHGGDEDEEAVGA